MKKKFVDYYMGIAETTALLSYAKRLKVGAVVVKDHQIIGTGYNGTVEGWDNNCEEIEFMPISYTGSLDVEKEWPFVGKYWINGVETDSRYKLKTKPEVLHAEMNCIIRIAKSTESSENATLFCTHTPCIECSKIIYQAGIKQVYYRHEYRSNDGVEFLKKCGIHVKKYDPDIQ